MSSHGPIAVQGKRHTTPQLAILATAMTRVLPTLTGLRKNPKTVVKMIYDAAGIPIKERLHVNQWLNPRTTIGELYRSHAALHPSLLTSAVQQLSDTPPQTTVIPFILQTPMTAETTTAATPTPTALSTNLQSGVDPQQTAQAAAKPAVEDDDDNEEWYENTDDLQTAAAPIQPSLQKRPRIVWSSEERSQVAARYLTIAQTSSPTTPVIGILLEAQKVLPLDRQRRTPDFGTIEGEVRLLANKVASTPVPVAAAPVQEAKVKAVDSGVTMETLHKAVVYLTETVQILVAQNKSLLAQVETLSASLIVDPTVTFDADTPEAHFCVLCDDEFIGRVQALFSEDDSFSFTISNDPKKIAERVQELADYRQELFILNSDKEHEWILPFTLKIMKPYLANNFNALKSDIQNAFDAED